MSRLTRGRIHSRHYILFAVCCFGLAAPALAKRKDDVVIMKHGDRMTGEIKNLDRGILYFKSSYMNSSVQLDWDEVASLQSQDPFIVRLTNGMRIKTSIERSTETEKGTGQDKFTLESTSNGMVVSPTQVIEIEQAEVSFFKQLNGDANFGVNYTSGANPTTLSSFADITYQGNKKCRRDFDQLPIQHPDKRAEFLPLYIRYAILALFLSSLVRVRRVHLSEERPAGS
jgi:hypothetical protein